MVSRRSTQSVTQRSTRQSELHMTRRPRRLVAPKTVDDAVGLSRKEERELKKALYASLQESRRPRTPLLEEESTCSEEMPKLRKSTRHIVSTSLYPAGIKERSNVSSASMDESSQDSVMSSVASSHESKKKVHAQRKFAQGCSGPSTPSSTPNKKAANASHSLLDRVPKTEDFLTFLCLRGSHLLPANLDFFNFARDESFLEEGSSRPRTPVIADQGGQNEQTRESTPESSSSGSNVNEELLEITTPLSTPSRLLGASRKAARASAGTPETARGIVSLRQGLTRKVVHSGATTPSQLSRKYLYTPEKTPSPSSSRLAYGDFTPAKKSASMNCLPASFLRFSSAGKLALERNGNSPQLTPYKTPAAPSPLHSSKVKGKNGQGQGSRQCLKNSKTAIPEKVAHPQAKRIGKEIQPVCTELSHQTPEKSDNAACELSEQTSKECGTSITETSEKTSDSPGLDTTERSEQIFEKPQSVRQPLEEFLQKHEDSNSEMLELAHGHTEHIFKGKGDKHSVSESNGFHQVGCIGEQFTRHASNLGEETCQNPQHDRAWSPSSLRSYTASVLSNRPGSEKVCDHESGQSSSPSLLRPNIQRCRSEMPSALRLSLCDNARLVCDSILYDKSTISAKEVLACIHCQAVPHRHRVEKKKVELKVEENELKLAVRDEDAGGKAVLKSNFTKIKSMSISFDDQVTSSGDDNPLYSSSDETVDYTLSPSRSSDTLYSSSDETVDYSLSPHQSSDTLCTLSWHDKKQDYNTTSVTGIQEDSDTAGVEICRFEPSAHVSSAGISVTCDRTKTTNHYREMNKSDRKKTTNHHRERNKSDWTKTTNQHREKNMSACTKTTNQRESNKSDWTKKTNHHREKNKSDWTKTTNHHRERNKSDTMTCQSQWCDSPAVNDQSLQKAGDDEHVNCHETFQSQFLSFLAKRSPKSAEEKLYDTFEQHASPVCLTSNEQDAPVAVTKTNIERKKKSRKSHITEQGKHKQRNAPASRTLNSTSKLELRSARVPDSISVRGLRSKVCYTAEFWQPQTAALQSKSSLLKSKHKRKVLLKQVKGRQVFPRVHENVWKSRIMRRMKSETSRKPLHWKNGVERNKSFRKNKRFLPTMSQENNSVSTSERESGLSVNASPHGGIFCLADSLIKTQGGELEPWNRCCCSGSVCGSTASVEIVSQSEGVKARTSHTPLPCPPVCSLINRHQTLPQAYDRNGNIHVGSRESSRVKLWQPSLCNSPPSSHYVYTSDPSFGGVQDRHVVLACMCGSCCLGVNGTYVSGAGCQTRGQISPPGGSLPENLNDGLPDTDFMCMPEKDAAVSTSVDSTVTASLGTSLQAMRENVSASLNLASMLSVSASYSVAQTPSWMESVACESSPRVPTGVFKPVEPALARGKKEARASSSSPVRKILEGASKKLRKSEDAKKRLLRSERKQDRSRDIRAKQRRRVDARRTQNTRKIAVRTPKRDTRLPEKKPKRRSSMRIKTLAKILGRKRPNYSLVHSGYADMEEYEEEQKKKAAKSALTKAKAEARARTSIRNAARPKPPKEPAKMTTRSSRSIAREVEGKRHSPVKRSLSTSSTGKKEQTPLATIVETKRLKREGGRDTEGKDTTAAASRQGSVRESSKKSASAASPLPKRVTPKKSTPEKPAFSNPPDSWHSTLEKVPTFYPSEDDFTDPITYIESIREKAEPFGMCRIIPPASWKMESKVNEEIRFTTQMQHLHRLFNRWGSSVEQTRAIVHHLQDIMDNKNSGIPQIGGVEVDLPQLYRMIRDLGGLQNIVDKKQWVKVADAMKIPKMAHDRVTRLYDVYCKFVLPYAMLSEAEREQAQKDVHTQYELSSAEEDAIFKGKSMTLGTFSRIARNVQSMWFREDPNPEMVEAAYWKIVEDSKSHLSVQCAHVNTRTQSTAFPMRRESPYFRHSWNLNNLPDNKKCILKCLGPVSGTTIPTLHVGMLFSTSCWSTDPHRLPYVQYLHSGANTIWYCIPKSSVGKFHETMKDLCPTLIHNDPLWLSEDTAMVKAETLKEKGVQVVRCVQQPRQFVVVFPDVYTATVCCGYNVSESVHYATTEWLSVGIDAAKALCTSGEKELFSVDTLVCGLCQDSVDLDTVTTALPMLQAIVTRELEERRQLSAAGLKCERRLAVEDSPGNSASVARKRSHDLAEDSACEVCYKICYLSMVLNEHDEQILCLEHGLRHVQGKRHVKAAKLFYRYTQEELTELVQTTKERLASLAAGSNVPKKRILKKQDSKS